MALDFNMPLVIHCRDAEDDCFEILSKVQHLSILLYLLIKQGTFQLQPVGLNHCQG